MKTLLTTGWSLARTLRFVIGAAAMIFAVRNHDILLAFAGGLLLLMAVFNFGCCAVSGCNVPVNIPKIKPSITEPELTSHEEVV